uniref:Transcriptional regulator n=1 Tax=Steinernema glaseri TaxID=37863 RepID=A0A1I8A145_9BILA
MAGLLIEWLRQLDSFFVNQKALTGAAHGSGALMIEDCLARSSAAAVRTAIVVRTVLTIVTVMFLDVAESNCSRISRLN